MQKTIGYVVMPPGTGKSYNHDPNSGIFDASTLVPRDSTSKLLDHRESAKRSGNWGAFDREWSKLLNEAVPNFSVLLIPSHDVALGMGWNCLGYSYLSTSSWRLNFDTREDSADDYIELYRQARSNGIGFKDNETLRQELRHACKKWLAREIRKAEIN